MLESSNVAPFLSGIVLSVIMVFLWIRFMSSKKIGQYIREEGPEHHLEKAGIPTMGGIAFLYAAIAMSLFFLKFEKNVQFIISSIILFSLIGFYDDYKKIRKKRNEGLSAKGKSLCLLIVSLILYFIFLMHFSIRLPFTSITFSNMFVNIIFILFMFSALTNATNLTDGLDGLLTMVTIPVSILFIAIASWQGLEHIKVFNLVFLGALIGYLFFNKYPAKVFMGDLGSIGIGAYVLSNSILLQIYWFIPLFGIWYLIETLSVIIQVLYFKKTGGKRFFKMAPYHHHLEYLGLNEIKIDLLAFSVTSVASIASYYLIIRILPDLI